jgi:hypothetical protein
MPPQPLVLFAALAFQGAGGGPLVSKEGGFRVDMPAKAVERAQSMVTPFGPMEGRSFEATRGKITFYVSYNDYPPDIPDFAPDKVLERSMNGAVNGIPNAVPLAKRDIQLGDAPGKEFEFAYPLPDRSEALCRARFFLLGRRLYSVILRGPRNDVLRVAEPFLRSFALFRAQAKAPAPARLAGPPRPDSGFTTKPASSSKQVVTKVFAPEAGRFRVMMPGKPKERIFVARTGDGDGVVEAHLFVVEVDDVRRLASYLDRPKPLAPEEVDAGLEEVVRGSILSSGKGTLVSTKPIRLGETPGREFEFDIVGPDGRSRLVRARAYLDGPRIYQVLIGGPKAKVVGAPGDAFLNSFALTGSRPAAAPRP